MNTIIIDSEKKLFKYFGQKDVNARFIQNKMASCLASNVDYVNDSVIFPFYESVRLNTKFKKNIRSIDEPFQPSILQN